MSDTLASLFAFGDRMKRNVRGLLSDPLSQIQRNVNSWAGGMNDAMQTPATNYIRAGGVMANDPSTQAAALAEANRMTGALLGAMPGGMIGATVWHGSPHKFAAEKLYRLPDGRQEYVGGLNKLQQAPQGSVLLQDLPLGRFRPDTIGTGEGAQAYGHGSAYLAESPDVAMGHRSSASGSFGLPDGPIQGIAKLIALRGEKGESLARKFYKDLGGDLEPSIAGAKAAIDGSSLYKVDLPDEHIAKMLDWDKPLSQQSAEVKAFAEKVLAPHIKASQSVADGWGNLSSPYSLMDEMTGSQFLQHLRDGKATVENIIGGGGPAVSGALRQAGIPGIRYLDGGSRGAGQGTSNFVVFPGEEGALRILERNGVSLADLMGQSGKIDGRLLAALGIGGAGAWAGSSLLSSSKQKMEDAKKARQQAIEQAEGK